MPPKTDGVLETCLYVDDVPRARAFYERLFGFPVMFEEPRICTLDAGPGKVLILFRRGGTQTAIPVGGGFIPPHDASGPQHVAFAIPADSYDGWKAHLAAEGVLVESEVAWPRGGRSIYFYDPDGLMVELATPGIWDNY